MREGRAIDMSGGIFVLHDDGTLDAMSERPYDSESLLQGLSLPQDTEYQCLPLPLPPRD